MRGLAHVLPWARVLENHILELVLHERTLRRLLRVGVEQDSVLTVPETIFPEAMVIAAVRVGHLTVALELCIMEAAIVDGAVTPLHLSLAIDLVLLELANVLFTLVLSEHVGAVTVELALGKLTFISDAIHAEFTEAGLLAVSELAIIEATVEVECLAALTVILVVFPLAVIHGALAVHEHAVSVSLAVLVVSMINITIRVGHVTATMEQAVLGLTTIHRVVAELDGAEALPGGSLTVPALLPLA